MEMCKHSGHTHTRALTSDRYNRALGLGNGEILDIAGERSSWVSIQPRRDWGEGLRVVDGSGEVLWLRTDTVRLWGEGLRVVGGSGWGEELRVVGWSGEARWLNGRTSMTVGIWGIAIVGGSGEALKL
eukprot:6545482-Pyramimonas_sp.AAC.1